MSKEKMRCLYAENLRNKRVKLKIGGVRNAPKPLYCNGQTTGAWDVIFDQKNKDGETMYLQIPRPDDDGKSTVILRQFTMATGTSPSDESIGQEITLYPVQSKKSATGQAIRIAVPEQMA